MNKSTIETRHKNLSYIRVLYLLFAFELIIALVWSSICLAFWPGNVGNWWILGMIMGIVCLLIIFATLFVAILRKFPINWAIYFIFVICFAIFCAWVTCIDVTRLFYFALWLITIISIALAIYAFLSDYYMDSINTLLIVLLAAGAVLMAFISFTKLNILYMILVTVPVVIFGCYLAYDMRSNVRSQIFDHEAEDPVSGAVRIWIETVLVFCRFGEMLGGMFTKKNLSR